MRPARVEPGRAPNLRASFGIVAGDVIAAVDDELLFTFVHEERGRGVGVGRFADRIGGTLFLPEFFAVCRIESDHVRAAFSVALQDLNDELSIE